MITKIKVNEIGTNALYFRLLLYIIDWIFASSLSFSKLASSSVFPSKLQPAILSFRSCLAAVL